MLSVKLRGETPPLRQHNYIEFLLIRVPFGAVSLCMIYLSGDPSFQDHPRNQGWWAGSPSIPSRTKGIANGNTSRSRQSEVENLRPFTRAEFANHKILAVKSDKATKGKPETVNCFVSVEIVRRAYFENVTALRIMAEFW